MGFLGGKYNDFPAKEECKDIDKIKAKNQRPSDGHFPDSQLQPIKKTGQAARPI